MTYSSGVGGPGGVSSPHATIKSASHVKRIASPLMTSTAGAGAAHARAAECGPFGDFANRLLLHFGVRIALELHRGIGELAALPRRNARASGQQEQQYPSHQNSIRNPTSPNTLDRSPSSGKPG